MEASAAFQRIVERQPCRTRRTADLVLRAVTNGPERGDRSPRSGAARSARGAVLRVRFAPYNVLEILPGIRLMLVDAAMNAIIAPTDTSPSAPSRACGTATARSSAALGGGTNQFRYAASNPVANVDPRGLLWNMVHPKTHDNHSKVDDAIALLNKEFSGPCNACSQWFHENAVPKYKELNKILKSGPGSFPIVANVAWDPNFWPPKALAGTQPNQDNTMHILDDVLDNASSCLLASLIMYELIHMATGDPFTSGEIEDANAFTACTSGCVNPSFQ